MKSYNFIFLRLSIYLMTGVLFSFLFEMEKSLLIILNSIVLFAYILSFIRSRKQVFAHTANNIPIYLMIIMLGFNSGYFCQPINQDSHIIQLEKQFGTNYLLQASVEEELKPTTYHYRYIVKASYLKSASQEMISATGKILLRIERKNPEAFLSVNDKLLIPFKPVEILPPLNPFQFDFKKYMKTLKVEKQINLQPTEILILGQRPNDIRSLASEWRAGLIENLKTNGFKGDELAVFQALILGQRRDISDELYKNYAAAGAVHILAISGLHIGILLLFFNFLLRPVERLPYGKIIKAIILILILWCFALVTGLSPSVVRAVSMFSFLAVGMQLNKKTSSLNSLFLSFFFLVIINPYFLFQVGFQLSYLAVFGIIVLQPIIYRILKPKGRILDYFWKLTTASIAAQIAVLPLSLFYFHQFPGLFLLTNIVILPCLGFILISGLFIILGASFNILPGVAVELFGNILNLLNSFVTRIASYEIYVMENIRFSLAQTIILYLIFTSLFFCLTKPNYKRLVVLLGCVIVFQGVSIWERFRSPETEFVIFHSKEPLVGSKSNSTLLLNTDWKLNNSNLLKDYIRERGIKDTTRRNESLLQIQNKKLLIVDSTGIFSIPGLKPEVVLLTNSPKINLERLIRLLNPKIIVANSSNYPTYLNHWKRTCMDKKIPFHYTGEKGAYILNDLDTD